MNKIEERDMRKYIELNKKDNLLDISNTLENILYVLERIESKIYEEKE